MAAPQVEHSETLTMTYESNPQRASAKAVGAGLLAVQAIVDDFNSDLQDNERILVKARPFTPGSLELPLDLLVVVSAELLIHDFPWLQKLREIIAQFFDIKVRLRGQPIHVEDGNVVIIQNSRIHVDQITLQCLNPASNASRSCSEAFRSIEEDQEIKAVRITSDKEDTPLAHIQRDSFPYLHPETPVGTRNLGQRYEESRETLVIRQPAFDAELAWRFVWQNEKISAQLEDETYQKVVESGRESFAAGDSFEVDLRRLQEYDPASQTYIDKSYTVTHVWKHSRREKQKQQTQLFE
jgi:hypothetical protein